MLPEGVSAPVVVLPVVFDVATEVEVLVLGAAAGLQPTVKANIAMAAKDNEASFAIFVIKKTVLIREVCRALLKKRLGWGWNWDVVAG
jgi:hypothetical protein